MKLAGAMGRTCSPCSLRILGLGLLFSVAISPAAASERGVALKKRNRGGGVFKVPYSGVPFLRGQALQTLPSSDVDGEDAGIMVTRLLPNPIDKASPHACDGGNQADKGKCLSTKGRGCMWTRVEGRDPTKAIQEAFSYCLPCILDGNEIPCWNVGAFMEGREVTDCEMTCTHHKRIWQPEYACSDESGFISNSECFNRASLSQSKCMYITYQTEAGEDKSSCAPCHIDGSGGWGCPAVGGAGPTAGTSVTSCVSQCDVICPGPPACPPTVQPPPPPPPPSPGLIKTSSPGDLMLSAPAPWPMPTINPFAIAEAAANAAKAAGWTLAKPAPPKSYIPVIIYRSPDDYAFTTGPPIPAEGEEPAPPVLLQQVGPHEESRFGPLR